MSLTRSRWAAIGAAVAVTLGGGGLIGVSAASGDASSFTSVTPTRVLNTRTGAKLSTETIELQVTGSINTFTSAGVVAATVVPSGANAVAVNVTVTGSETKGYVSVFPCTAKTDSPPNASTLNFNPGVDLANSTVVEIGSAGKVCFYVKGTTHLLADVQGYFSTTELDEKLDLSDLAAITQITRVTVDATGNVGETPSIAIGASGLPIISYYDTSTLSLKVAACANAVCTGIPTITTVDDAGGVANVGYNSSIAIGTNGLPIISYYDSTNGDLKVAACTTSDCSGASTITTVDSTGNVGYYTSIAIGATGNPIIAYEDATNHNLKVLACGNATCTGTSTATTVDSDGNVGYHTSIAIGANGLPIISYYDGANTDLKVAACTTANCSTSTTTTVDSTGTVGWYTSIAIGNNGLPIISYYDATNADLKVAACTTANCSSSTNVTVDSDGDVGYNTSIVIGATEYPMISYHDSTNDDLKLAVCTNASCTGTSTITTVDSTGDVGWDTSIAISSYGYPIIAYYDNTNADLRVITGNM